MNYAPALHFFVGPSEVFEILALIRIAAEKLQTMVTANDDMLGDWPAMITERPPDCRYTAAAVTADEPKLRRVEACSVH